MTTTAPWTERQIQAIAGLARGHTRARIGHDLGISPCSVRSLVDNACRRSGRTRGARLAWLVDQAYRSGVLAGLAPEPRPPVRLSTRQKQILLLIADGHTTPQISQALGVSEHTVRSHVLRLRRLLQARSRSHAVALAHQQQLLTRTGGPR